MRNKYMIIRKDNGTYYNEDANVFCKCGTIYKNKQKAIQKMEYAKKYAISNDGVEVEVFKLIKPL